LAEEDIQKVLLSDWMLTAKPVLMVEEKN